MFKKICLLVLLSSALIANQAYADSSVCRASLNKLVQNLSLDDSQKAKIKPILEQLKTNMKGFGSQMQGLEDGLSQQTYSANLDQSKVNDLVDKKTKLIGDMIKARVNATNQVAAVLNPQQKDKLQTMMKAEDEKIANEFKKCEED